MLAFNDPTEYSKASLSIPILGTFKKQKGERRVEIMMHPRSDSFEWGTLLRLMELKKIITAALVVLMMAMTLAPTTLAAEPCGTDEPSPTEPPAAVTVNITVKNLKQTEKLTITLQAVLSKEQVVIEATKENGYSTSTEIAPGSYKVVEMKSDKDGIKIVFDDEQFDAYGETNDVTIKAVETEVLTLKKFIKNNAITGGLLIICGIALLIIKHKKRSHIAA